MWHCVQRRVAPLFLLFFCTALFGCQSASTSHSTFHVSGKITQSGSAVPRIWVTFEGASTKSVEADASGLYETDLPLGVWTVAVSVGGRDHSSASRPRVFRVKAATNVVLDLFVRPAVGCGGLMIMTPNGRPPTSEEVERRNEICAGQEFFPDPSMDGVPFEVLVGGMFHGECALEGVNEPDCRRQFATYNLLTVRADNIVYHPREKTLEASGDVVIEDETGEQKARSIIFYIQDGRAIPMHRDR